MKTSFDIIVRPIISEKSMSLTADKTYTFEVLKNANKFQIKKAVEEIFGVKVASVNTVSVPGKLKRQGRTQGYTKNWKKAIVSLTSDSKAIEFFESM